MNALNFRSFALKRKKPEGVTLIGFVLILAMVVFASYIGMKIIPIYMDYYSVVSAMKGGQAQPGIAKKSANDIKAALFNRLYINYVDGISERNIKLTRRGGLKLRVTYEVRKTIMGNLDVVAHFDKSVTFN